MPSGNILVGQTGRDIKHNNGTLTMDAVITQKISDESSVRDNRQDRQSNQVFILHTN
jgi:hypothetical protein